MSLTNKREILAPKGRSTVFCQLCGDMIYARNVVHYGEGVIEDEDGSRRAEKETDLCPECALYVSQDKHKDDIARLGLMVRAIASAENAGYPQWQLEAMAAGWERRMAKGPIEDFKKQIEADLILMAKFEGRA